MSSVNANSAKEAAVRKMRLMKLEALEKGDLTDFQFLAGQDKETAEVKIVSSHFIVDILLHNA